MCIHAIYVNTNDIHRMKKDDLNQSGIFESSESMEVISPNINRPTSYHKPIDIIDQSGKLKEQIQDSIVYCESSRP